MVAPLLLLAVAACLFGCGPVPTDPVRPRSSSRFPASWQGTYTNRSLLPRTAVASPASPPLFERLDPRQLGIDFVHQWQPRDAYETNLLRTGFTGGGVSLGDYDQDGNCDIYLTRPHGGGRLFRNLGGFRFQDVTRSARLEEFDTWTTGSVWVDLDNDGWLDLVVCGFQSPNHLYLNQRDGTFQDVTFGSGLDFQGAHVKLVFADYDRDGDLDAFLVTNRREPRTPPQIKYQGKPGNYTVPKEQQEWVDVINLPGGEQRFVKAGQIDRLFRNEGSQSNRVHFTDVTEGSGIVGNHHGLDAIWWDYDQDGYPDLYVGNDFTDPDRLYHNKGDGRFEEVSAALLSRTPWSTMACGAGDFNNDGLPDLFLADMAGTSRARHLVALASMESMGWFLDFANPPQYLRNCLFLNSGAGRFMEMAELAGVARSDWTWSAKVGDLDEDGREDLFISNGFTRDYLDVDFLEAFRRSGAVESPAMWEQAPILRERNLAFQNQSGLRFQDVSRAWGVDELGISFGAALGDLDGDGDLDLVVNNFEAAPGVYRNNAAAGHHLRVRLVGQSANAYGIGAEVRIETSGGNQLRQLHPGNGYMSADEPILHFGLGNQTRVERLTVRWPGGALQEIRGLPADQLCTVFESAPATAPVPPPPSPQPLFVRSSALASLRHVAGRSEEFETEPLLPYGWSQFGPAIAWGDLNGDGQPDFLLTGGRGQAAQVALHREGGGYSAVSDPGWAANAQGEDLAGVMFDCDGDGDLDFLMAGTGAIPGSGAGPSPIRIYRNDGSDPAGNVRWTSLTNALPIDMGTGGAVCVWDFDRDGDLDLFVGGRVVPGFFPTAPRSWLLENVGGRFVDVTSERAPELIRVGMVTDALASDVDQDGWGDLMVTLDHGAVHYLRNGQGRFRDLTDTAGLGGLLGMWNGIAAGDVDRDGDIDYVVSNLGRNLPIVPDADHPEVLLWGDLDGSGRTNLVVAHRQGGRLWPAATRGTMSALYPAIRERTPTYRGYGQAALEELLDPKRVAAAQSWVMNTPDSGVLLNEGGTRFRFMPFPLEAQNAPSFGVVVFQANSDAFLDVFLAQNFSVTSRDLGKLNNGLSWLLTGRGDGTFQASWPRDTGLAIGGDVRSAREIRLVPHGQRGLALGLNNGSPEIWASTAGKGARELAVTLRGKPGNVHAVGARVETLSVRGVRQCAEVYSGREIWGGAGKVELRFRFEPGDEPRSLKVWWPQGGRQEQALEAGIPRVELVE